MKSHYQKLLQTIFHKGECTEEGRIAMVELSQLGENALDALLNDEQIDTKSELHPRVYWETYYSTIYLFAKEDIDLIISRFEEGQIGWYTAYTCFEMTRCKQAENFLIEGANAAEAMQREHAIKALAKIGGDQAEAIFFKALCDRSIDVKGAALSAFSQNQMYDRIDALPQIDRILKNKIIIKHRQGIIKRAERLKNRILANKTMKDSGKN